MSLFGNNGIRSNTSNISSGSPTKTTSTSSASQASGISGSGLKQGDVIKGEIVDLGNDRATIRTSDNKTFSAKLDSSSTFDLNIGMKTEFEVVNASPTSLALKVRSENYMPMQDMAVQKALEEAGLPKNERNTQIVRELLNQQLSIDKQMITKLLSQSYMNKDVSLSTLALMNKHGIPVTEANAKQFESYLNQQNQFLAEAEQLAGELPALLANTESVDDMLQLHGTLTNLAVEGAQANEGNAILNLTDGNRQELIQLLKENNLLTPELEASIQNGKADTNEIGQLITNLLGKEGADGNISSKEGAAEIKTADNENLKLQNQLTDLHNTASNNGSTVNNSSNSELIQTILKQFDQAQQGGNELKQFMSSEERQNLAALLKDFPVTEEQLDSLRSGDMKSSDLLKLVQSSLEHETGAHTDKLLSSKEYQSVLTKSLMDSWTLTPEQLSQEKQVNELYNRMHKQLSELDQMMQNMKQNTETNASLSGNTKNMRENIDFMNHLNQLFPYVQLPVRIRNQTLNSDLYVYTKKKDLKSKTGEISVLLHLDLEHLKSLDIHVTLVNKQVSAKFYMEDKEAADVITENLEELENGLKEKGYLFTSEVMQRKKEVDIVKEFIEKDSGVSSLKRYSFDIRA